MDRAAGLALLAVVLVAALVGGTGTGAAAVSPQTDDVDPDGVVMRADVAADGTATWTIEYRVRLDDENVTRAFEGLQADIRANRSAYADRFAGQMERTVAAASNATGREMRLTNVSVTAETRQLPQTYGVVSYRFEWIGFARVDGDRLRVGDALSGLFLDRESRLIVGWPAGYEPASVAPEADERRDRAVVWEGPVDFGPDQPRVVLRPAGGLPMGTLAVGALVVLGAGAAALLYRRRDGGAERDDDTDGEEGDTPDADGAATPDEPPEDLLSPEERVLKLVRERGGRVKQQAVVEAFDWTAARTSQVVSSLREDGRIETFRLGRENVLTLPDTGVVVEDEEDEDDGDGAADEDEGVDWRP